MAAEDDWLAVFRNLSWARVVWKRTMRNLSRERAELRVSEFFFKSVVQTVLLFRSYTRVITPCMGRALGGF